MTQLGNGTVHRWVGIKDVKKTNLSDSFFDAELVHQLEGQLAVSGLGQLNNLKKERETPFEFY